MHCVNSALFSFLINGVTTGNIIPRKGLQQGDPISSYLFLFVSEGLLGLLNNYVQRAVIRGYRICQNAPVFPYLLLADDTIIFCDADVNQARAVQELLGKYEKATGQLVNFSKSNVSFSQRIRTERRNQITHCLDSREVLAQDKYLGLPTFVGRSRKKPFISIVDRIKKRMAGGIGKLVSWAGKEVLIKAAECL